MPEKDLGLDFRWEGLYARHRVPLYRVAAFLLGDAEGEDIVQEAYERGMKRHAFFEDVREPGAWLRKVVIRLALGRLRRRAITERLRMLVSPPQTPKDPDLALAIRRLPATQRGAVLLHYYLGADYEEVAVALGLSQASVGKILARARASMREELK